MGGLLEAALHVPCGRAFLTARLRVFVLLWKVRGYRRTLEVDCQLLAFNSPPARGHSRSTVVRGTQS